MSPLNGFNGQQAGRLQARPQSENPQGAPAQNNWQQTAANPQWGQQQTPQGYAPAPQSQGYGAQQAAPYAGLSANPDPYAPSFEPYAAAPAAPQRAAQPSYQPQVPQQSYQPQAAQQGYAAQGYGAPDPRLHAQHLPAQQQWAPHPAQPNYPPQAAASYRNPDPRHHESEPALSDWSNSQNQNPQGYGIGDAHPGHDDMGYAQTAGGEHDQGYAEGEDQEFEAEETGRGWRPMMIAAALVGAIVVGAGGSYGYKTFLGGGAKGTPPMVKSAVEPSKTKPADAGGKQFAHTDSKIMGRLGDGAAPDAAGEVDANGTRKVSTLVVGRDGSIQPPAAAPVEQQVASAAPAPATPAAAPAPMNDTGVPGMMLVDALGTNKAKSTAAALATGVTEAAQAAPQKIAAAAQTAQKLVVTPPAAVTAPPPATGSIEPHAAAAPVAPKKVIAKKVAAAAPTVANGAAPAAATAPATSGGANGFVAVLASVPKSANSQVDALKRYADMQQKYGSVLAGKTPSVAEANLGAKGAYHRLVVGPPASREQASAVCSQLKTQGYADCWVTSY